MKNILLIVFGLAIFFGSFQVAQAATNNQANYYGYQSRKVVQAALDKHPSIPEWKKGALMSKLSEDGYFWMSTKLEKFNYIQKNLRTNIYLSVVAQAENISRNSLEPKKAPSVTYKEASLYQKELLESAQDGVEEWEGFYDRALILYKNNPTWFPSGGRYEYSSDEKIGRVLECKKCWARLDLDRLYIAYMPDKKTNRSKLEFDSDERLYVGMRSSAIRAERWSGKVYTSDELLMFIPVERVVVPLVKLAYGAAVKGVVGVGSKVVESGTFKVGARVVGDKLTAIAGTKVVKLATETIITIQSKFFKATSVNVSKMFEGSTLADWQVDFAVKDIVRTIDDMAGNEVLGKYIQDATAFPTPKSMYPYSLNKILVNIKIVSRLDPRYVRKVNTNGWFEHETRTMYIFEENVTGGFGKQSVFVHELFHFLSKNNAEGVWGLYTTKYYSNSLGRRPLEEAFTQFFTKSYYNDTKIYSDLMSPYAREVAICQELYTVLVKRSGEKEAMKQMAWIHFEKGHMAGFDQVFGNGAYQTIFDLMKAGKYSSAVKYIKTLK